jgi:hypothetical protein
LQSLWNDKLKHALAKDKINPDVFQREVYPDLTRGRNAMVRGKLHGAMAGGFLGLSALPLAASLGGGLPQHILQGLGVAALAGTALLDTIGGYFATKGSYKMTQVSEVFQQQLADFRKLNGAAKR